MKNYQEKIKAAVQKFGTPAYVYDGEQLVNNYLRLKNALPEYVDVFYALKVNPNVSLVKLLRTKGACTEVCSIGELETALCAGSTPEDIIFLGPCKKNYELERAISLGIFALVIESEEELSRASKIAGELGKTVNVAIRINPDFSAEGSPWKMGGRPTHFGIEEARAVENFGAYLKFPNVNIRGIHVYNGTNILDARSVYENSKYILGLYEKISLRYNCEFSMVDVGGGMGVPYFANQNELDIVDFENLMVPLFDAFREKYPDTRIIMESGRFIAGTAGYYAVSVNNVKYNHGKLFAVVDGGTNHHSSAAGTGRVVKRNFPMENISSDSENTLEYQVAGPLCSPDDLLARNLQLTETKSGDIIIVKYSGAYGPTSSPGLFHSHGFPAEVLSYEGKSYCIRKRDAVEDVVRQQVVIDFECESILK